MEPSRRTALLASGGLPLLAHTGRPVPLSKDIQLVVAGMDAVGKALLAMPQLSAEQKSTITQALAGLDAAAKNLLRQPRRLLRCRCQMLQPLYHWST